MLVNSSDYDPNLIFGDLISRLYEIENSTFEYLDKINPNNYLHVINKDGFKLNSLVALPYFDELIVNIDSLIKNLDVILDKISFKEEPSKDMWILNTSITEIRARTKASLILELSTYSERLKSARVTHIKLSNISQTEDGQEKKIRLKISVVQFGTLIRLLNESDIFDEPNETELCRLLSKSFVTKRGGPSLDTLRNAIINIDSKGLDYWDKKLPEMQGKISKIRKL